MVFMEMAVPQSQMLWLVNFFFSLSCYFHQISESERHNQDLSRKVFFPSPPSISRDGDGKIWIYSFLSSIGLEGDMKCANVYFCCLGFTHGYLESLQNKKVGFDENECLIFIKLAVGLTFVAVSENV